MISLTLQPPCSRGANPPVPTGTHRIGGCLVLGAGLEVSEKSHLPGFEPRFLSRPLQRGSVLVTVWVCLSERLNHSLTGKHAKAALHSLTRMVMTSYLQLQCRRSWNESVSCTQQQAGYVQIQKPILQAGWCGLKFHILPGIKVSAVTGEIMLLLSSVTRGCW